MLGCKVDGMEDGGVSRNVRWEVEVCGVPMNGPPMSRRKFLTSVSTVRRFAGFGK